MVRAARLILETARRACTASRVERCRRVGAFPVVGYARCGGFAHGSAVQAGTTRLDVPSVRVRCTRRDSVPLGARITRRDGDPIDLRPAQRDDSALFVQTARRGGSLTGIS